MSSVASMPAAHVWNVLHILHSPLPGKCLLRHTECWARAAARLLPALLSHPHSQLHMLRQGDSQEGASFVIFQGERVTRDPQENSLDGTPAAQASQCRANLAGPN